MRTRTSRVVHVTCATPDGFRWLCRNLGSAAVRTDEGFLILDESSWRTRLLDAEGIES